MWIAIWVSRSDDSQKLKTDWHLCIFLAYRCPTFVFCICEFAQVQLWSSGGLKGLNGEGQQLFNMKVKFSSHWVCLRFPMPSEQNFEKLLYSAYN